VSARRRRGGHGDGGHGPGMERWLLTYADMITLLLALFVILFAISTINGKKFIAFKLGVTSTFSNKAVSTPSGGAGLLPKENSLLTNQGRTATTLISPPQEAPPNPATAASSTASTSSATLAQIANEITKALRAAGLSQYASTTLDTRGVVVQMLADKTYFATDSATLGAIGDQVVDTIAGVLRTVPNDVEVQGYTNNLQVTGGPYSSNWELSAVRAVNVVRRLSTTDRITANRLSATGFGTTHPVVPNTTPANKAENRRVDVVVLTASLSSPSSISGSKQ
jgi:chemotaxis protein MotB